MNKKVLSLVALCMSVCMSVGTLAGCDLLGSGSSGGGGKQLTQDEIYAEISKAMDATLSYNGGITMKEIMAVESTSGGYRTEYALSIDPATKRIFSISKESRDNSNNWHYESTLKFFEQNNNYYMYDKLVDYEDNERDEEYKKVKGEELAEATHHNAIVDIFVEADEYLGDIQSLETINAAYAEVVANTKTMLAEEVPDGSIALDGRMSVTCDQAGETYFFTKSYMVEMATGNEKQRRVEEIQITARNGYITNLLAIQEETAVAYTSDERVEVEETYYGAQKTEVSFEYSFDERTYNAIPVQLPSDVKDSVPLLFTHQYTKTVVINGVLYDNECPFTGYGYQALIQRILDGVGFNELDIVWYIDEACTKPLTADIPEEEFAALPTLYAKATVAEDYNAAVVFMEENRFAEGISEGYKLVFTKLQRIYGSVYNVDDNTYMITKYNNSSESKIYVNGVELVFAEGETAKTITV